MEWVAGNPGVRIVPPKLMLIVNPQIAQLKIPVVVVHPQKLKQFQSFFIQSIFLYSFT